MSKKKCDMNKTKDELIRELEGLRLRQLHALASHLQNVREEERIQVARELHDELSPVLTVLKMGIVKIGNSLAEHTNGEEFKDLIKKAKSMEQTIDDSVEWVRRIITRLRPGILDDLGLIPAIEWQVKEFQENFGIICNLRSNLEHGDGDVGLNSNEFTAVFRIFQELLTNIVRHAGASKVEIALKKENECFIIEVEDNGRGIKRSDIDGQKSFGIIGMREWANLYGWNLSITGIEGKGTKVSLTIPQGGKPHE